MSTSCINEIENCKVARNFAQIALLPMFSMQISVFKYLCFSKVGNLLVLLEFVELYANSYLGTVSK